MILSNMIENSVYVNGVLYKEVEREGNNIKLNLKAGKYIVK
ncbi:hypothetical protein [Clostridium sp. SHJSY1]|nr:hypothetical protein [Clostridium sp. SHJSY1]